MKHICKISKVFFLVLICFAFALPANAADTADSGGMERSQAKVIKRFPTSADEGASRIFYELEKALLENGYETNITCKQSTFPVYTPAEVNDVFSEDEISSLLTHTTFPHCKSEKWGKGPVGRGVAYTADRKTADEFCRLMGYEAVIRGSGNTGSFTSYGNELVVQFDGTNWVMVPHHNTAEAHFNYFECGTTKECVEDSDCPSGKYCLNNACVSDKPHECIDGKDNDGDGLTDSDDLGCKDFKDPTQGDILLQNDLDDQYANKCRTYTMNTDGKILITLYDDDVAVVVKRAEDSKNVILAKSNDNFPFGGCALSSTPINQEQANSLTSKVNKNCSPCASGDKGCKTDAIFYNREGTEYTYYEHTCGAGSTVPVEAHSNATISKRVVSLKAGDVVYLATRSDKKPAQRKTNTVRVYDGDFGETLPYVSSDSDANQGNNQKYTKGKTVYTKGKGSVTFNDACTDNNTAVYEHYSVSSPKFQVNGSTVIPGTGVRDKQTCQYGCSNGACYKAECEVNYGVSGRACTNSNKPYCNKNINGGTCEACPSVTPKYNTTTHTCVACLENSDCQSGYKCLSNACVLLGECEDNKDNDGDKLVDGNDPGCQNCIGTACKETQAYTSSDTDGGDKPYTKGKATYTKGTGTPKTAEDTCKDANTLYEYYNTTKPQFGSDGKPVENYGRKTYPCDYGCKDGACYKTECDGNYGTSGRACPQGKPYCDKTVNGGTCTGCPSTKSVYDTTSHQCVVCLTDSNCSGTTKYCKVDSSNPANNKCVGCTKNSQCSGTTPICGSNNTCVACSSNTECSNKSANTPYCVTASNAKKGSCVECVSKGYAKCTSTQICDESQYKCTDCGSGKVMYVKSDVRYCGECNSNADCKDPANSFCNLTNHTCTSQCSTNADCEAKDPLKPVCNSGVCVECTSTSHAKCTGTKPVCLSNNECGCNNNSECPTADPFCNENLKVCTSKCTKDSDCSGATPACNVTTGKCVECTTSNKTKCTGTKPVCLGDNTCGCTQNSECPSTSPFCDASTKTCTNKCTKDSDCPTDKPVCDTANGQCVECTSTSHAKCTGTKPVCLSSNECGCNNNSECPSTNPFCSETLKVCTSKCTKDSDCPTDKPVCDTANGQCVECTSTSHAKCTGTKPVCLSSNECGCNNNSECPSTNPFCSETLKVCTSKCTKDSDCPEATPICDTTEGVCVECKTKADCKDEAKPECLSNHICGCNESKECPDTKPFCDATQKVCIDKCTTNDECKAKDPSKPVCNTESGNCEECVEDTDCEGNKVCEKNTNTCVECTKDTDCEGNQACDLEKHTCYDTQKAVTPLFNCIIDNYDDTYIAYFGYENPNGEEITINAGSNEEGAKNLINNSTSYKDQTSTFKTGKVAGAFYVPFKKGQTVTWTLQNNREAPKTVQATSASVKCALIEPYAQCIDRNKDGSYKAHFGYINKNEFEVEIPDGKANFLSPYSKVQTDHFIKGKVDNAFSVDFTDSVTWNLNGKEATATKKTSPCAEIYCTETSIAEGKKKLNGDEFVAMLEAQTELLLDELNPYPYIRDIEASADRRENRADKNNKKIKEQVAKLPDIMLNCDNADFCPLVDNEDTLNLIWRKLRKLRRQVGRTIRQRNILEKERTKLLNDNSKILAGKKAILDTIPRFANDCD